jgi:hypothetical protein
MSDRLASRARTEHNKRAAANRDLAMIILRISAKSERKTAREYIGRAAQRAGFALRRHG